MTHPIGYTTPSTCIAPSLLLLRWTRLYFNWLVCYFFLFLMCFVWWSWWWTGFYCFVFTPRRKNPPGQEIYWILQRSSFGWNRNIWLPFLFALNVFIFSNEKEDPQYNVISIVLHWTNMLKSYSIYFKKHVFKMFNKTRFLYKNLNL